MSCRGKQSVKHFPVTLTENGVALGSKLFETIHLFISHFQSNPVIADESGHISLFIAIVHAIVIMV